jgi:hypothetical protein
MNGAPLWFFGKMVVRGGILGKGREVRQIGATWHSPLLLPTSALERSGKIIVKKQYQVVPGTIDFYFGPEDIARITITIYQMGCILPSGQEMN